VNANAPNARAPQAILLAVPADGARWSTAALWDTLEEIAAKEEASLPKFLTTLHNEVLDRHGEVNNFASLLRCSCLIYRSRSAAFVPDFSSNTAAILDAAE